MVFGKKKNGGFRCEPSEGDVLRCQVFKVEKEGKMATGTDFSVRVARDNNCEPQWDGPIDILDEDEDRVAGLVKQKVRDCKRGLV